MGSNLDATIAPYLIPFDISGFYCLSQVVFRGYQDSWNTFNRVQIYNINVSTVRSQTGGKTYQLYYQFTDFQEKSQFTNGRALHIRRYPNSNWAPVPEN
jgi:hypothetical protein